MVTRWQAQHHQNSMLGSGPARLALLFFSRTIATDIAIGIVIDVAVEVVTDIVIDIAIPVRRGVLGKSQVGLKEGGRTTHLRGRYRFAHVVHICLVNHAGQLHVHEILAELGEL